MNKGNLVETVASKTDTSKAQAERTVNAVLDGIKKGLKQDKVVQLIGFGTFKVIQRKARKGRNPQTGAEINIPASRSVSFKVGKALKGSM